MKTLFTILALLFSSTLYAGTVHSLRTDSDGNVTASVKGGDTSKLHYTHPQINLDVSGTNWTTIRAVGVAYTDGGGNWWLRFSIFGDLSSSSTNFQATIDGVTFKNATNYNQAVAVVPKSTADWSYGHTNFNSDKINCRSGTAQSGYSMTGDVELESKPTWVK